MYKLVVLSALLAIAAAAPAPGLVSPWGAAPLAAPIASPWGHAGLVGAPWGHGVVGAPWGHGVVSAPYLGAPVVKTAVPVATSYANTVRIASPAVVAAPAPLVAAHAPVYSPYAHAW